MRQHLAKWGGHCRLSSPNDVGNVAAAQLLLVTLDFKASILCDRLQTHVLK